MPRKVSRRNTKHNRKSSAKQKKRSSTKHGKRTSAKQKKSSSTKQKKRTSVKQKTSALHGKSTSVSQGKKFTGRKLLPRRAIIFPEPIMDGGGVDKEMLGL